MKFFSTRFFRPRTADRLFVSGAIPVPARKDAAALRRIRREISRAMAQRFQALLMLAGALLLGLAAQRLMTSF